MTVLFSAICVNDYLNFLPQELPCRIGLEEFPVITLFWFERILKLEVKHYLFCEANNSNHITIFLLLSQPSQKTKM